MFHRNKHFVVWLIAVFLFAINGPVFSRGQKKKYGDTTIKCQKGHQNPANTKFCITCGESVTPPTKEAYCPDGHKNTADAKFCQQCGKKMVKAAQKEKADYSLCPDGHKNARDAKFCKECGKEVKPPAAGKDINHCPEGHINPQEAAFCHKCGKKIPKEKKRRDAHYKNPEKRPDMTKDRGKWPAIVNLGFFVLLAVGIIIATSANETTN